MPLPETGLWLPNLFDGASRAIDFDNDTFKCALVDDTWNPDTTAVLGYDAGQAGQEPADHESTGTGYTAGGISLTSVTPVYTSTAFYVTAAQIQFSGFSSVGGIAAAVIYDDTTVSAPVAKPIITCIKFRTTAGVLNGTLTVPLLGTGSVPATPVNNTWFYIER